MCLIVVQPKGSAPMGETEFRQAFECHSDGGGIMFAENGRLQIWKPFWKAGKFLRAYRQALRVATGPIVLHFRYATHGAKNALNTHPHPLAGGRVGVVHNGILPVTGGDTKEVSDTVVWCRSVFDKEAPETLLSQAYEYSVRENYLVGSNKLVFLGGNGRVVIWGETGGWWNDGKWFSNRVHSWKAQAAQAITLWDYEGWKPSKFSSGFGPVSYSWEKDETKREVL
jgi:hypothetical protein